jgi:hypothetical protein
MRGWWNNLEESARRRAPGWNCATRYVRPFVLERPAQGELDQARSSGSAANGAEWILAQASASYPREVGLNICDTGGAKVGVVPQVEEIRRKAKLLAFADLEIFDQRKVPILLERALVEIAAEIAEAGSAKVGIGRTLRGIQLRRRSKDRGVQITVDALVDVAAGQTAGDGGSRRKAGAEQGSAALTEEGGAGAGIENRERRSGLENSYATDGPSAQRVVDESARMPKEGKFIDVAHGETVRAVEIGNAARGVDVALVIVGGVESGVSRRSSVDVLGESVGRLKITAPPTP